MCVFEDLLFFMQVMNYIFEVLSVLFLLSAALVHRWSFYQLQNEKLEEVLLKMKQEMQQMTKWVKP